METVTTTRVVLSPVEVDAVRLVIDRAWKRLHQLTTRPSGQVRWEPMRGRTTTLEEFDDMSFLISTATAILRDRSSFDTDESIQCLSAWWDALRRSDTAFLAMTRKFSLSADSLVLPESLSDITPPEAVELRLPDNPFFEEDI